jgi:anti-sigma factor ChrR (cupin superfamily)
MKKWTRLAASAAVAAVAMLPGITLAQTGGAHAHTFATAKDLKWNDTPALPGAKLAVIEGPLNEAKPFILRLKFPANYKIPAHFHSAIEHVTVISGEFFMGVGEKFEEGKGTALKAGDVGILQAKTPHYAYTKQAAEVQVHGVGPWTLTFVNPKDDPRNK